MSKIKSKTNYTPGLWFVSMQGIDDVYNKRIVRIALRDGRQWGNGEADRKLIAAAPAMLEALKKIFIMGHDTAIQEMLSSTWVDLKDAIKMAIGKIN